MNKKERKFIEERINQYRLWAAEEYKRARCEARDKEEAEYIREEGRKCESAADTIELLLGQLEEL